MKKVLILSLILCVFACKQNDDDAFMPNSGGNTFSYSPINSAIKGVIVDNTGNPVFNARIELLNDSVMSNEVGYFSFESQEVNAEGTLIKISASGYFDAFKMVLPSSSVAFESVVMVPRILTAVFDSGQGSLVAANDGATIEFPSNAIANADGTPYTGQVEVYAHWIDPSDYVALQSMPGDLRVFNSEEGIGQMSNFGMISVELQTPNGAPLNMLEGSSATVSSPLPADFAALAETTIPILTFNEQIGFWEEEGEGSLTNGKFVAEVSHFSWTCYAYLFFDSVNFDISVVHYFTLAPLAGAEIAILVDGVALTRYGQLDSDGSVSWVVPRNEELSIGIFYKDCLFSLDIPVILTPIGSFDTDIVINGWQTPDFFAGKSVNLSGDFLNCDGNTITNGMVTTSSEALGKFALTSNIIDPLGSVFTSFISCEDKIDIKVYDFDQSTTPTIFTRPIPLSSNTISLSGEVICPPPPDEYLTINWDGQSQTFTDLTYSLSLSPYNILEINNFDGLIDQDHWISIGWQDVNPSVGEVEHLISLRWEPDYVFGSLLMDGTMNITEFGAPGEDIKGTFEGIFPAALSNLSIDIPYNGSFSIKNE